MRRFTFTIAATVLLLALAPASALAHHHRRGHHHARISRFGDASGQSTTTSSPATAGTVASFTNGVLTITLNDGSTVSGNVTGDTEIECTTSGQSQGGSGEDNGSGDQGDQSSTGTGQSSTGTGQSSTGDAADQSWSTGDQGSGDDDQGDQGSSGGDQNSSCSSASLTPGAVVQGAELRFTSAGATWEKVTLVS